MRVRWDNQRSCCPSVNPSSHVLLTKEGVILLNLQKILWSGFITHCFLASSPHRMASNEIASTLGKPSGRDVTDERVNNLFQYQLLARFGHQQKIPKNVRCSLFSRLSYATGFRHHANRRFKDKHRLGEPFVCFANCKKSTSTKGLYWR